MIDPMLWVAFSASIIFWVSCYWSVKYIYGFNNSLEEEFLDDDTSTTTSEKSQDVVTDGTIVSV